MSAPADLFDVARLPVRRRPALVATLVVLAVVASGLVTSVATAPPAHALHQHCGDDLHLTGSRSNGHPQDQHVDIDDIGDDPSDADKARQGEQALAGLNGWGGNAIIHDLQIAERALVFARNTVGGIAGNLDDTADVLEALAEAGTDPALAAGTPVSQAYLASVAAPLKTAAAVVKGVATALVIADIVLFIGETAVASALFDFGADVADEKACGGTLMGDTLHMSWVAMVQRNLASTGPPLAMLMAPSDPDSASRTPGWPLLPRTEAQDFPWCPPLDAHEGSLPAQGAPTDLPDTGGDCVSTVQLGWLDAPDIGVADVVETTIAHLTSHGVDVRHAASIAEQAREALDLKRYSDAFYLYREAYQTAMAVAAS